MKGRILFTASLQIYEFIVSSQLLKLGPFLTSKQEKQVLESRSILKKYENTINLEVYSFAANNIFSREDSTVVSCDQSSYLIFLRRLTKTASKPRNRRLGNHAV
jgi:hypothetical protein